MNPLAIFSMILPVVTEIPTFMSGLSAVIKAISAMHASGAFSAEEIEGAVATSLPAIAEAITANTPQAAAPAPAA